jgi:hypothetical protein
LVGLHRLLAFLSRDSHWFGILVKGKSDQVIRDGVVLGDVLDRNCLSEHDLVEDMCVNGNLQDPKKVRAAYFETRHNSVTEWSVHLLTLNLPAIVELKIVRLLRIRTMNSSPF